MKRVKQGASFMSRMMDADDVSGMLHDAGHGGVQAWLGKADAIDAVGGSRAALVGSTGGSATSESARYHAKLRAMANDPAAASRPGPRTKTQRSLDRVRANAARTRARTGQMSPEQRANWSAKGSTANAGVGGGGGTPPPTTPGSTANAGASDAAGFFETTQAAGIGQHLGMMGMGAVAGGGSAWLTGGSIAQGAMFGGALGGIAGAKNADMWTGVNNAHIAGRKAWAGRSKSALAAARASGDKGAIKEAKALHKQRKAAFKAAKKEPIGVQNAAMTAGGIGLASGVMFSGHKRKNVNGYNSHRGNYIGR